MTPVTRDEQRTELNALLVRWEECAGSSGPASAKVFAHWMFGAAYAGYKTGIIVREEAVAWEHRAEKVGHRQLQQEDRTL